MTVDPYPDLPGAELPGAAVAELDEADSRLLAALSRPSSPVVTAVEDQLGDPGAQDLVSTRRPARGPRVPVFQDAGNPMASDPPVFDDALGQDGWRVRFTLPLEPDLPRPPEGVTLVEIPARRVGAVRFSGTVRPARVEDVGQMARVHVRCWQETYRGLMSDAVLDDPGLLAARERFWTAVLTDERAPSSVNAPSDDTAAKVKMANTVAPTITITGASARSRFRVRESARRARPKIVVPAVM